VEAGQGESEAFDQAEQELIEHASHGDQHAARRAVADAPDEYDDPRAAASGEPDHERTSEREEHIPWMSAVSSAADGRGELRELQHEAGVREQL
jgi:hypothetical protein